MRLPLIAGNWKMNGSRKSVRELIGGLIGAGPFNCEVVVFPPAVLLGEVQRLIDATSIRLGAQNVDWHDSGAFTGEISAPMLVDFGCSYCLVGHSERRHLFGESDQVVAEKYSACLKHSLTPVLCVGETLEERQSGTTMQVVERQLAAVTGRVGVSGLGAGIIAYEPVWAIGTGESATPEQAENVHAELRAYIQGRDSTVSADIRILYGGSVSRANAAGLLTKENIDGALVGGASLHADEFTGICEVAENVAG